jgi:hypothetical protein
LASAGLKGTGAASEHRARQEGFPFPSFNGAAGTERHNKVRSGVRYVVAAELEVANSVLAMVPSCVRPLDRRRGGPRAQGDGSCARTGLRAVCGLVVCSHAAAARAATASLPHRNRHFASHAPRRPKWKPDSLSVGGAGSSVHHRRGPPAPGHRLEAPNASVSAYRTPGSYRAAPGKRRRAKCICFCVPTHPACGAQRARRPLKVKRIRSCVPGRVASSSNPTPESGPTPQMHPFLRACQVPGKAKSVGPGRGVLPFSLCS